MNIRSLLLGLVISVFSLEASASVGIDASSAFTNIDAYSARADVTYHAAGESATLVIEFGATTAYGSITGTTAVDLNESSGLQFSVTGFSPSTTYHYRYKITGNTSKTVAVSVDRTFTTIAATPVDTPTAPSGPALVEAGNSLTLSLYSATGSDPFTYQWKKNGANVGAASRSSSYHVSPVKASDGGTWTCKVSNPSTFDETPGKLVTIVTTTKVPTATIAEGGTFSASVSLSPANPAATYLWHEAGKGSLPSGIGTVTGSTSNKLTVSGLTGNAAASYECDITIDSTTLTVDAGNARIGLKPVVDPIADQMLRVGTVVNIPVVVQNAFSSVSVTGLPAGIKYDAAHQLITGVPLAPTPPADPIAVVVVATNVYGKSAPLAFPMYVDPLDAGVLGTFNGTIERDADTKALGGKVTLSVTSNGKVTGSIALGAAVYPINSTVTSSATSTKVDITLPTLKSGSNPVLNVILNLDQGLLTGTVQGDAGTANASGAINPWNTFNPMLYAGNLNCSFKPGSAQLADAGFPHGYSFGTVNLSSLGVVSFSGRTADGTVVTASSALGKDNKIPLFAALYSGNGSILGQLQYLNVNYGVLSGNLSWQKNAAAGGRLYNSGFTAHDLACSGSLWVKPNATLGRVFLNLTPGTNNAKITFSDATLTTSVLYTFTVSSLSTVSLPSSIALNPNSVTLTLNAATGQINGTFKVTDTNPIAAGTVTRIGTYYGLAMPGPTDKAFGFFTIADLPAAGPPATNTDITKNPMRSGIVEMGAP